MFDWSWPSLNQYLLGTGVIALVMIVYHVHGIHQTVRGIRYMMNKDRRTSNEVDTF